MEWSFYYSGPIGPTVDYDCVTCLAGKRQKCPTHGTTFERDCAHCQAAQGGPCRGHWGVTAALAAHPVPTDEGAARDWAAAAAAAAGELATIAGDRKMVEIKLRGDLLDRGPAGVHREIHLELTAR